MKVGDKVRILDTAKPDFVARDAGHKAGDILTIEHIWKGVRFPIYTNKEGGICWAEKELEVVND